MTQEQEEFPSTVTGTGTDGSPVGSMGEGTDTTGGAAEADDDTTDGTDEAPATDA
jgi:hypothetical protein